MHPSTILSALIAPAVLVAACGSLVISTSQRINNVVNLLPGWSEEYAALNAEGRGSGLGEERRAFLYAEIGICTRRARFLQTALMALYVGAGLFVTTGIAVAASALFAHWDLAWGGISGRRSRWASEAAGRCCSVACSSSVRRSWPFATPITR
jgi:hypothetical protein